MSNLLLGMQTESKFAVVENAPETGPLPPYLPTYITDILPIDSICNLRTTLNIYQTGIIPFDPVGMAPYTVIDAQVLPGVNMLEASQIGANVSFSVSFPILVTIQSSDNVVTTQQQNIYTQFSLLDLTLEEGKRFLLDLTFEIISLLQVFGNVLEVTSGIITGTVSQIDELPISVTVAEFVQCGEMQYCECEVAPIVTTTTTIKPLDYFTVPPACETDIA